MISAVDIENARRKTREFFEKMGFDVDIEVSREQEDTISIKIKTEEPRVLIGRNGEVMADIHKILALILKRKSNGLLHIDLDINSYKEKKAEYLQELAREIADRVSLTKKERTLNPMPSYERRIVHLALAEREDVITESVGQGEERRVVIKPRS